MSLKTEYCAGCHLPLFEQVDGNSGRKIFRSFATKVIDGEEKYFCIKCHERRNSNVSLDSIHDLSDN